ncbi:MAG: hypothetical protein WC538_24785 [Thermoanaerobaculia bacterium]
MIYPSLTGQLHGWGPYVFKDGTIKSRPSYLPHEVVRESVQLPRRSAPN